MSDYEDDESSDEDEERFGIGAGARFADDDLEDDEDFDDDAGAGSQAKRARLDAPAQNPPRTALTAGSGSSSLGAAAASAAPAAPAALPSSADILAEVQRRCKDLMTADKTEDVIQKLSKHSVQQQYEWLTKLRKTHHERMQQKAQQQQQQKMEAMKPDADTADLLEQKALEAEDTAVKAPVFSAYAPKKVRYGGQHVEAVVESSAMACVDPPDVTYEPSLPRSLLRGDRGNGTIFAGHEWGRHAENALSAAQLETVVYAGQRHAQMFDNGTRCGFFLGDGTGVGKGRQIAATILDNISRGRPRHIWCSISTALLYDARRDLSDLGRGNVDVHALHKMPYGDLPLDVEDGVMFTTYQSLIAKNKFDQSRLDQLIDWVSGAYEGDPAAFDGCLVFDEAHRAKNLAADGKTGKGSKTADAVTAIQQRLPNARVLYVSATAASETRDLGYMVRLGLWGDNGPFRDFSSFASQISKLGVGAMEIMAMDMKARGMFTARMLAFTGCTFHKQTCTLTDGELEVYDAAAVWWDKLLMAMDRCAELTLDEGGKKSLWGAHQAFFKQLLNSMKAPYAIAEAEAALAEDPPKCVVIGLLSTGEAKVTEAVERERRQGNDLDQISTPTEIAKGVVERHLPTQHRQTNVQVPEAIQIRNSLLRDLEAIRMPDNALDILINHFGTDNIAELTGRKMRLIRQKSGQTVWEPRAKDGATQDQLNIVEKDAFLSGRKLVAVISEAASSGISLHADARFANTRRRLHITLELAWSAEKMLQQFGRTHRSNQVTSPHYILLTTNVGGENRFASSVARRLESLGAMTQGDRRGGHGAAADLVQYNLDTALGHSALALMTDAISENAQRQRLWDKAIKLLRCERDGVPMLLGLSLVAMCKPSVTAKYTAEQLATIPEQHRMYINKLSGWASDKGPMESERASAHERAFFGKCPKTPLPLMSWVQAGEALRTMRLLNSNYQTLEQNDRYNINKFLNRLLGLPVATQNALFAFYTQVFRWAVVTAKAKGKGDNEIALIDGETVEMAAAPEVLFRDPHSSAVSTILSLRQNTGLSWASALPLHDKALRDPGVRSTQLGGLTGFWVAKSSGDTAAGRKRVVLAVEMVTSHANRELRMCRIYRPTLHVSAKPQFVPGQQLRAKWSAVRELADAEARWAAVYSESSKQRVKEVRLLCGAIMPVWNPLCTALRATSSRQGSEITLAVKKVIVDGTPYLGVNLTQAAYEQFKARLSNVLGGREADVQEAQRAIAAQRAKDLRAKAEAANADRVRQASAGTAAAFARSSDPQQSATAALAAVSSDESSDEEEEEATLSFLGS